MSEPSFNVQVAAEFTSFAGIRNLKGPGPSARRGGPGAGSESLRQWPRAQRAWACHGPGRQDSGPLTSTPWQSPTSPSLRPGGPGVVTVGPGTSDSE